MDPGVPGVASSLIYAYELKLIILPQIAQSSESLKQGFVIIANRLKQERIKLDPIFRL